MSDTRADAADSGAEPAAKRQRVETPAGSTRHWRAPAWVLTWFDYARYRSAVTGKTCSRKQWVEEGKKEAFRQGSMVPALEFVREQRKAAASVREAREIQISADDANIRPRRKDSATALAVANAGCKRYCVGSLQAMHNHLCASAPRERCMYAITLDHNGSIPLLVDIDVKEHALTRAEFIAMIKKLIAHLVTESNGAVSEQDFVVDDTFETTDVDGMPRCSAHVICRRIAFKTHEEARQFNLDLARKHGFSDVDVGIPKSNGLFKWVGCCKRSKGARWQFPNPTLALEAPEKFSAERRATLPYREIVTYEELRARRPWYDDDADMDATVRWRPRVQMPLAFAAASTALRKSPLTSLTSSQTELDVPAQAPWLLDLSLATETQLRSFAYMQSVMSRVLTAFAAREQKQSAAFYGRLKYDEQRNTCTWSVRNFRKCAPNREHRHNNCFLTFNLNTGHYAMRCFHPSCPQHRVAHPEFSGRIDSWRMMTLS